MSDLDTIEADIRQEIARLIPVRDQIVVNWNATVNNRGRKTTLGKDYNEAVATITRLNDLLGDGGYLYKKEDDINNAPRNAAIRQRNARKLFAAARAKQNQGLPDDQLVAPGPKRAINDITDIVTANYRDGDALFGGPTVAEIDDAGVGVLSTATDIYQKHSTRQAPQVPNAGGVRPFIDPEGYYHDDEMLWAFLRGLGYDGKPVQVTEEEFDDLVANGWTQIHRGVSGSNAGGQQRSAQDNAQMFIDGAYFASGGGGRLHGVGTYFGLVPQGGYYPGTTPGGIAYALRPDAKIIQDSAVDQVLQKFSGGNGKRDQIINGVRAGYSPSQLLSLAGDNPLAVMFAKLQIQIMESKDADEKLRLENAATQIAKLRDKGWVATVLGYDAIYIPSDGYITLLNRTAGVVLNRPTTSAEASRKATGRRPAQFSATVPVYSP